MKKVSALMALVVAFVVASSSSHAAEFRKPPINSGIGGIAVRPVLSDLAPAVIAGYAALVDPLTHHRYVMRGGGAVSYYFSIDAHFTRRIDGRDIPVSACIYMCGKEVDDTGAVRSLNSRATTAFGYVVVFHADPSSTYPDATPGHGYYNHLPITAVVTYNPDRFAFSSLVGVMQTGPVVHGVVPGVVMTARSTPFEGMVPP